MSKLKVGASENECWTCGSTTSGLVQKKHKENHWYVCADEAACYRRFMRRGEFVASPTQPKTKPDTASPSSGQVGGAE